MFASMIFKKEPFFHGHDNYDQVCVSCDGTVFCTFIRRKNVAAEYMHAHVVFQVHLG